MIHGENLIVAINGEPLAASKSCSIGKSCSFIKVTPPTGGQWETIIPKKRSWDISADCLLGTMDAYKALDAAWKAGTPLTIRFFNTEYNENEIGTAYIDSLDLKASKGSLAKMSVSLKGSGPLSEYAGTTIVPTKSLLQSGKYYSFSYSSNYAIQNGTNGKIYGGNFTLSKRTMVEVTTNNDIFFSQDNGLYGKAFAGLDILSTDYSYHIQGNTKLWLDAGTWYFVDSNSNYQYNPTFKAISL